MPEHRRLALPRRRLRRHLLRRRFNAPADRASASPSAQRASSSGYSSLLQYSSESFGTAALYSVSRSIPSPSLMQRSIVACTDPPARHVYRRRRPPEALRVGANPLRRWSGQLRRSLQGMERPFSSTRLYGRLSATGWLATAFAVQAFFDRWAQIHDRGRRLSLAPSLRLPTPSVSPPAPQPQTFMATPDIDALSKRTPSVNHDHLYMALSARAAFTCLLISAAPSS